MSILSSEEEEEVVPIRSPNIRLKDRILSASFAIEEPPGSNDAILVTDFLAITNKAIPNQFRLACKKHVKCTKYHAFS